MMTMTLVDTDDDVTALCRFIIIIIIIFFRKHKTQTITTKSIQYIRKAAREAYKLTITV